MPSLKPPLQLNRSELIQLSGLLQLVGHSWRMSSGSDREWGWIVAGLSIRRKPQMCVLSAAPGMRRINLESINEFWIKSVDFIGT